MADACAGGSGFTGPEEAETPEEVEAEEAEAESGGGGAARVACCGNSVQEAAADVEAQVEEAEVDGGIRNPSKNVEFEHEADVVGFNA